MRAYAWVLYKKASFRRYFRGSYPSLTPFRNPINAREVEVSERECFLCVPQADPHVCLATCYALITAIPHSTDSHSHSTFIVNLPGRVDSERRDIIIQILRGDVPFCSWLLSVCACVSTCHCLKCVDTVSFQPT